MTERSTATSSESAGNSAPQTRNSMQSTHSMASDTASTSDEADLALSWSGRWSLAHRILALNLLTVVLVALCTLYLDVFRNRLSKERTQQTRIETATAAAALAHVPGGQWPQLLAAMSRTNNDRLRLYGADGRLLVDSWSLTGPSYQLVDPSTQKWTKDAARAIDRGFNANGGADPTGRLHGPALDPLAALAQGGRGLLAPSANNKIRNAPD